MSIYVFGKGSLAEEIKAMAKSQGEEVYLRDKEDFHPTLPYVLGFSDPKGKQQTVENLKLYLALPLILGTHFSKDISFGLGTVVCMGAMITTNFKCGKGVTINVNVTIGHDVTIGDFSTLHPCATVGGFVNIGKRCLIGSRACIKDRVNICDDVVVGAGAVVVKDITEPGVYVGVPAKLLKQQA